MIAKFVPGALAIALAGLAFYVAGFGTFDSVLVSALAVWLGVAASLLRNPSFMFQKFFGGRISWPLALILLGVFTWAALIWVDIMWSQEQFLIEITFWQHVVGWAGIAALAVMTWAFFGVPIFLVIAFCAAYILLPRWMGGAGDDWARVAENIWFSTDGVFGQPVEVVSRTVLVFILFGAVLQVSGTGDVLLKMSFALTRKLVGGPAHAAIVGSGLCGTLSGAAVANVVTTGVVTIPMMKRAGFKPRFAAAVEAAASTGGQIMPPVMGVVAFLMADMTGIPYVQIILAALIPALLYYGSLFVSVYLEARRLGISATPLTEAAVSDSDTPAAAQKLTRQDWIGSLAFWLPLGFLVFSLIAGRSAQNAGFMATIAAVVMSLIVFPTFRSPKKWLEALLSAGYTSAQIMVIVAAIGFVIGTVNMTGIGLRFAEAILSASGDNLLFSLILVMLGCIVLGMGVPTGAAYLIIAVILGPSLQKLGLPMVAAHLFIVYFGVMSAVTPPVALAAFAAAPIAGARPMETGFEALRMSVAGFIIPFVFCFHTDLLIILDDFSLTGLIWALIVFAVAIWSVASGASGYDQRPLSVVERALRFALAFAVLVPSMLIAVPALAATLILFTLHRIRPSFLGRSIATKD